MLSIFVSSKDPELVSLFNLPRGRASYVNGQRIGATSNSENEVLCYTIDPEGYINYPLFGELYVAGKTKFEVSEMIRERILASDMVKDPIVTVEFANLTFSTLGAVASPGQYEITKDKTTIFDALSLSGDLLIDALRDKVFVTRHEGGEIKTYQLDLTSTDIYQSPAFYIQQNDMIYVEPNKKLANQSTVNGNTLRTPSFWMSFASFILTITLLLTAN